MTLACGRAAVAVRRWPCGCAGPRASHHRASPTRDKGRRAGHVGPVASGAALRWEPLGVAPLPLALQGRVAGEPRAVWGARVGLLRAARAPGPDAAPRAL